MRCAIVTTRFIEKDMRGGEEAIRILVNNLIKNHDVHLIASDMTRESYSPQVFGKVKQIPSNIVNERLQITYVKSYYFAQRLFQELDRMLYYVKLDRTKISLMFLSYP